MLKKSIHDASRAALQPVSGLSYSISDLRFIHNLRKLLDAAKQFHTSASSTAGSTREGTTGPWVIENGQDFSETGEFPASRRRWVESYVRAGRDQDVLSPGGEHAPYNIRPGAISTQRLHSSPKSASFAETESINSHLALYEASPVTKEPAAEEIENIENTYDYDDDYNDAEAERGFQQRLQSLAKDMIRRHDYQNAIDFLHKALQSGVRTAAAKAERRQLQIQITLCHFLQGDWEQAEVSMSCLSKSRNDRDAVVCTFLHALALAHLRRYSFDMALSVGQRALQGRKRLLLTRDIDNSEVDETRALLATIYNVRGGNDDYIRADVFREQISKNFTYIHPRNEVAFIKNHPTLIPTVLGSEIPASGSRPVQGPEVPVGVMPKRIAGWPTHALSQELAAHERYKKDTEKHVLSIPMQTEKPMFPQVVTLPPELEASRISAMPPSPIQPRLAPIATFGDWTTAESNENTSDSGTPSSENVSPKSRWLRISSVLGLGKVGSFLRKTPSRKHALKRFDELRPGHQWFSRKRGTIKMAENSEREAHHGSAGHSLSEWDRAQPRDIDASSLGSEDSGRGNLLIRTRSDAGGSMVSHHGYNGDLRPVQVPLFPYSVTYDSTAFTDHQMFQLEPEFRHEMDDTQITAMDNTDSPDASNNQEPEIDDMLDSEMNEFQVSEVDSLYSATELSGSTKAEVELLPKHKYFGHAHHDPDISPAEPETVSSFANPRKMPRSSPPISSAHVGRDQNGPEVRTDFLESASETVDSPLSAPRYTQSTSDSVTLPGSLKSPRILFVPGETRHRECLASMHDPDQLPTTNARTCMLPIRPTVADSGDNGCPEPSRCPPRSTCLEKFHAKQGADTRRGTASPDGSYFVAAQETGDSGYVTAVAAVGDSRDEPSSCALTCASSLATLVPPNSESAFPVAPNAEDVRHANTSLHTGEHELAASPEQHVPLVKTSDKFFNGNASTQRAVQGDLCGG